MALAFKVPLLLFALGLAAIPLSPALQVWLIDALGKANALQIASAVWVVNLGACLLVLLMWIGKRKAPPIVPLLALVTASLVVATPDLTHKSVI